VRRQLITAVVCCLAAAAAGTGAASAGDLRVAAAADLQVVFPRLAERFQSATGDRVVATFGSSGNFFSQIRNGAPFDVFLSADAEYPTRLVAERLAYADSESRYAAGRLVVWARTDSGIDVRAGLRAVLNPRVKRVAIANPEHAPYGRAALAALRHEGLYDAVMSRLVLGENISQTAQFVESGNAQVGLIALSIALAPALRSEGTYAEVPATLHPPIEQTGVVLIRATDAAAARRFLAFLREPDTVRLLEEFGFGAATRPPVPPRLSR